MLGSRQDRFEVRVSKGAPVQLDEFGDGRCVFMNETRAPAPFPQRRAMPLTISQPSFPSHPNHNIFPKMRASTFHFLSG